MRVGFTGTRHGMADEQHRAFIAWAKGAGATEFHHGDCIGADDQAADTLYEIRHGEDPGPPILVVSHPPDDRGCRAFNLTHDEERPAKPYLTRNRDIVDETDLLVACPQGMAEEQRSGTWATVRYARKAGKPVVIVWPDGTVTREG